ncbi:hypothetical protein Tco_1548111 [Tanacetum coccineum]
MSINQRSQERSEDTSAQNMAFISSSNTNTGKSKVPTAQSFSTSSGQVYQLASTEDLLRPDEADIERWTSTLEVWPLLMNASIATNWGILLESAEHQRVRKEVEERATRRRQRSKSLVIRQLWPLMALDGTGALWLKKMKL